MDFITEILLSSVSYVHFISFGLLILAAFNIPISEDVVIIVSASIAASRIPENMYLIFMGCYLGAYISDIIAYSIGRYAGPRLLQIKSIKKLLSDSKISKMEAYFDKYGGKTLFFGRFIPFGFRNVMFLSAGLTKMHFPKFLIIDLCTVTITSLILFSLGYSFGKNYEVILQYVNQYKIVIFVLFLSAIVIILLRKKVKKN